MHPAETRPAQAPPPPLSHPADFKQLQPGDLPDRSRYGAGRPIAFSGLVLLVLLAWRHEILTLPPFEDQALGFWTEAGWLAEHGFDYVGLARQRHYLDYSDPSRPGVRTYVYNALPAALVGLAHLAPDARATGVLWHGLALAAGSITAGLIYALLRRQIGEIAAVLAALAVLTTPVVLAQADLASMEIFLLPAALTSLPFLARRRYVPAMLVAALALFVKATVLIHAFAILCLASWTWWQEPTRPASRPTTRELACILALFLLSLVVFLASGGSALAAEKIPWPRWFRLPWSLALVPDMAVMISVMACLLLLAAKQGLQPRQHAPRPTVRELLTAVCRERPVLVHSTLVVVGMLLGMVGWMSLPRYFAVIVPPAYLAICLTVHACGWQRILSPVLALVVALNLANAHGRLYPDSSRLAARDFARDPFLTPRSTAFRERSLEYLPVLRQTIAALAELDQRTAHDQPIFVASPYWYLLAQRHLGYVTRPHRIVYVNDFSYTYRAFEQAWTDHLARGTPPPVLVWTGLSRILLPAPAPEDEILIEQPDPSPLVVFIPRTAPRDPAALRAWYLQRSNTGQWRRQAALTRLASHKEHGELQQAADELLAALQEVTPGNPAEPAGDAELAFALREVLLELDVPASDAWLKTALAESRTLGHPAQRSSSTPLARWLVQLRLERRLGQAITPANPPDVPASDLKFVAPSLARLEPTLAEWFLPRNAFTNLVEPSPSGEVAPSTYAGQLAAALFALRRGHDARARVALESLQIDGNGLPETCQGLGLIHFHQGDYEAAAQWFERALALAPDFAAVRIDLAALEARRGNRRRAEALLLDAHRKYPRDMAPRIQLEAALLHDN